MLVKVKRCARVVAHDLAVGGRRALRASMGTPVGGADACVGAGWARAMAVHQVTVKDRAVGWRSHGFAVQLELLLRVAQLQWTRALVWRRLLSVRKCDGGRQVNVLLQERVGRLETAKAIPLQEGGSAEALTSMRSVHHLQA